MKKFLPIILALVIACGSIFLIACNDTPKETPKPTEPPEACANGHSEVIDAAVEPTCTETGLTEGKHCSVCGTVITEQKEIAAKGHTEGDWIITVDAACSKLGERQKKCTVCNNIVVTESIDTPCTSSESILVNLSGYSIVYKDVNKLNTFHISQITRIADVLKSEANLTITPVAESAATSQEKEILIGLTSRPESKEALDAIHGKGFTIRLIGNKIVIVGSDDTLTLAAVNYFIGNYLTDFEGTSARMSPKYTYCNSVSSSFITSSGSPYYFVCDDDLDRDPNHMFVTGSKDNMDFPYVLLKRLVSNLMSATGVKETGFNIITDVDKSHINGYEVLFGKVDRIEENDFALTLDAHEYGFYITDKKIIITAHCDHGLEDALGKFIEFFKYIQKYNNGNVPSGYEYRGSVTDQNWIVDFPRPEGENIHIDAAQHNNNNSLQIVYTGSGVNKNSYLEYCAKLEAAGYVIVTQNDNPGNTGSYFRTYKNTQTDHVLYVAFNAFKYKDVYKDPERKSDHVLSDVLNGKTVEYNMRDYQPCFRIVSAPLDHAYLPEEKICSDNYNRATEKITESSITTTRLYSGSVGMCYIIQLEDGSFFIIDGGDTANDDSAVLYNVLAELYKKAHGGVAPSKNNPIHIKAWLITHSHADHYRLPADFIMKYGKIENLITMDYLIGNYPEASSIYSVSSGGTTMGSGDQIKRMQENVPGGFDYIKVHTGQVLYLANLKVEVIMTTEDHAPFRINNTNDTNTVTKLTIRSENKDTTWMVLGDSCIYQSRWMCAMWGGDSYNTSTKVYDNSYLKSDMVQLAHHGNIGCEIALYRTIQGEVLWFPNNSSSFNSYVFNRSISEWRVQVDRYVARTLKTIKYIFVSGWYNNSTDFKDYHDSITLEFTADGPNYDDIWGVNYRKTKSSVVSAIHFNSTTGEVVDSPVIKKK